MCQIECPWCEVSFPVDADYVAELGCPACLTVHDLGDVPAAPLAEAA